MLKRGIFYALAVILTAGTFFGFGWSAPESAHADAGDVVTSDALTAGDIVYYGNYPQTNLGASRPQTGNEGADYIRYNNKYFAVEPIAWRVLEKVDGKLFLLADKAIDSKQYNETLASVTWETCTARSWLNGYAESANTNGVDFSVAGKNFIGNAFTSAEQMNIASTLLSNPSNPTYPSIPGGNNTTDKIFYLKIQDVIGDMAYFTEENSRKAQLTDYAVDRGAHSYAWHLRSPGNSPAYVMHVSADGSLNDTYVVFDFYAARPAFYLSNLESLKFTSTAEGKYTAAASTVRSVAYTNAAPDMKTGLTYTGEAQELVTAGSGANGTMQYSLNGGAYSAEIPTATNAGTYTIKYKVVATDSVNYEDSAESTSTVNIGKSTGAEIEMPATKNAVTPNSITINAATVSSNPGEQIIEYAINQNSMGAPSNDSDYKRELTFTDLDVNTDYYVWARTQNNGNCNAGTAKASAAIKTAKYPITLNEISIFMNIPLIPTTYPASTIISTAQYTGTISWSPTPDLEINLLKRFNYNTLYTATITLEPNENYTLDGVEENFFTLMDDSRKAVTDVTNKANSGIITVVFPKTFKRNPEITAPTAITGLTYTGKAQKLAEAGSAIGGTMQYALSKKGGPLIVDYSTTIPSATSIGDYSVWYKIIGDEGYSDLSGYLVNVTIGKGLAFVTTAPAAIEDLTYTGLPQELVTAGSSNDGEMQYKLDSGNYSTSIPTATNIGDYTVYYKVVSSDTTNYDDSEEDSISVTIGKRAGAAITTPPESSEVTDASIEVTAAAASANPGEQGFEYAKNTTNVAPSEGWQTSKKFTGLTRNTTYYIFARTAANAEYNAGTASAGVEIKTLKTALTSIGAITGMAKVGETLTAGTVSPAGATVTYQWKADGDGIGTNSTYKLTEDEVGKKITVTVTGSGDYTESVTSNQTAVVAAANGAAITKAAGKASVTATSITVTAAEASTNPGEQDIEYAINQSSAQAPTSDYQTGLTFADLDPNTEYYVWARTKATEAGGYSAGVAVVSAAIKTNPVIAPPGSTFEDDGEGNIEVTLPEGGGTVIVPPGSTVNPGEGENEGDIVVTLPGDGGTVTVPPGSKVEEGDDEGTVKVTTPNGDAPVTVPDGSIVTDDGEGNAVVTLPGGETVTVSPGSTVEEGDEDGTVKVTLPDGEEPVVVPDGSKVEDDGNGNAVVTLPEDGGTVTVSPGSKVEEGDDEGTVKVTLPGEEEPVTVPDGSTVTEDEEGNAVVTLPEESGGGTVTVPPGSTVEEGDEDGTVKVTLPDGEEPVTVPSGSKVEDDGNGNAVVTLPEEGGTVTVPPGSTVEPGEGENEGDIVVTLPGDGGTVTVSPGSKVEEGDEDGTVKVTTPEGEEPVTVPGGSTVTEDGEGNAVVTLPEESGGGTVTVPPGSTVEPGEGENEGDIVVTLPEEGGTVTVSPGSKVEEGEEEGTVKVTPPEAEEPVTVPDGSIVEDDGNGNAVVTLPEESGGGTVTVPPGSTVEPGEGGNEGDIVVTLPGDGGTVTVSPGSKVEEGDEDGTVKVTLPEGGGTVTVPPGSTVEPGEGGNEGDIVVTLPEEGGTVTVSPGSKVEEGDDDGTVKVTLPDGEEPVTVPDGSTVTDDGNGNAVVALPDSGGTVTVPPGSTVEPGEGENEGDIVVTLPGEGGTVTVSSGSTVEEGDDEGTVKVTTPNGDAPVTVPDGSTVTDDGNGNAVVTLPDGETTVTVPPGSTVEPGEDAGTVKVTLPEGEEPVTVPDGSKVEDDENGNAVVTLPDGETTVTVSPGSTVEEGEDNETVKVTLPEGEEPVTVPDGSKVEEDENGNAVVTLPEESGGGTVTVPPGSTVNPGEGENEGDIVVTLPGEQEPIVIPPGAKIDEDKNITYKVLKHFGTYAGSGTASATIDADHSKFVQLKYGNEVVGSANHEDESGSTNITLTEEYLKTLGNGTHTFTAEFQNGITANLSLEVQGKAQEYAISYSLNGGTNSASNPVKYTAENRAGIKFTAPTKAGFTFTGWTVVYANGSAANITAPNINYTIPNTATGNITLTANWAAVKVEPPAPVYPKVTSIKTPMTKMSIVVKKGKLNLKNLVGLYTTGNKPIKDPKLTWTSSKPKVATVSKTGAVKAGKKTGKTVITVKAQNGKKLKITITVVKKAKKLKKLTAKVPKLKKGKPAFITLKGTGTNITSVKWKVKGKGLKIDKFGMATVTKKGKFTITATAGGKKFTKKITVK